MVEPIKQEIDHGRRIKRQDLRDDQPTDDGDPKRAPQCRTRAAGNGKRYGTQNRRQTGHEDRAETLEASVEDRSFGRPSTVALALEGKIHEHDAVLLHNTDQQDNADEGHQC